MRPIPLGTKASCTAALLGLLSACEPPPPPTEEGVPLALAESRASTISGLRYVIELDIPASREEPITGNSVISFAWAERGGDSLVIDFVEPSERVRFIHVNGEPANWHPSNDHIAVDPSGLSAEAVNEVAISYVVGDEALNRSDDFLYALFVPDRAHFSIPVFDQPDLKGRVTWRISAPESWKVVANGPSGESTTANGRTRHEFFETQPIPTYLFAFVAGEFREVARVVGRRVMRMYHRETDQAKVDANSEEIFRLHATALDWLEEYTGIPQPFQKFDFVLIPSFQYGGMEHPGAIAYRAASLMLDESATQGQLLGRASLIAHETAHMWFGNLVTMRWFDDVWTKEVFANFMAAKIVHPSFPEVDHDLRFLTSHHPSAYGVDRTDGANPIRQPLDNLRFAGTLYGAIIYQKAPVVMRQLEARVGEAEFREGIRQYLGEFSFANATWPELIRILDGRTADDLSAWSRVWVEEPGRPVVTVAREGKDAVINQADPQGLGRVWPQRLEVRFGGVGSVRADTVELASRAVRVPGAGTAEFVLPNGSGVEYGAFRLDAASNAYLLANVESLEPAVVRGAAWMTLWDQTLDGAVTVADFMEAALRSLPDEPDELIVSRLLGWLGTAYWGLIPEAERARLAPGIETLIWEQVHGGRDRTARAAFLASYRRFALTDDAVARLRSLWSGETEVEGIPLSESDEIALASALALRGIDAAESVLDAQEARIEDPDRLARFRFVRPSLSADAAVRDAFFSALADPANREREPWVLAGLGNLHHPLRTGESRHLVRPALDMLEEVQRTGDIFFPGRWLDAALGGHSSVAVADVVQAYLDENTSLSQSLRLKVLQSADGVFRAARIVHGRS